MSQGHTIPILHLSRMLSDRHVSVTVITNSATKSALFKNNFISVINIPFPDPPALQTNDELPCMASFINYIKSTKQLQPEFEQLVRSLTPVTCIISDGFLIWTQDSADKLGIPRLVFSGMNMFSSTMFNIMDNINQHGEVRSINDPFPVPGFPRIKLTASHLEIGFKDDDPISEGSDFVLRYQEATDRSYGMVVNSFYELEHEFNDYWNQNFVPKAWLVGPFCVAQPHAPMVEKPSWVHWLDKKLEAKEPVLYVSFGTQAEASEKELLEVADGLEMSNISFMWVVKPKELTFISVGFRERVKGRGLLVGEWVDQVEILNHEAVCGFLSHCGWNSVLESLCAGVGILAMPLVAEQHLNAVMLVDEIGVGLRLWPRNMTTRGVVDAKEVAKMVVELMEGDSGKRVKKKVKEVKESAHCAMKEGGSSWRSLEMLIDNVCGVMHSKVKDSTLDVVNFDVL
ncbi:hypothetical protein QVD17_16312 [Tagetes erecta]|uniref:Glycosyltransferase n=1 Tax=Tagetes erecta TaxID=13708 RepID=A0AAD8P0K4_TARER|nr:hypothetical protein QVD17_16312 [Tagetes erecta]